MTTKLFRSRIDTVLAGVCGGIGHYLGIDAVIIRLLFVLFTIIGGAGILVYLILWLIVPREGSESLTNVEASRSNSGEVGRTLQNLNDQSALLVGGILVLLGLFFLQRNMGFGWMRHEGYMPHMSWMPHVGWMMPHMSWMPYMGWMMPFGMLWPLVLIALGALLLIRRKKGM